MEQSQSINKEFLLYLPIVPHNTNQYGKRNQLLNVTFIYRTICDCYLVFIDSLVAIFC